jgi:SecD/SecF fusion protein
MVRSINTTICILLPLVAILIFGGPTLKDFAMALTIGVAAGTYSSFFVASPLVTIWKEREPRYRRRVSVAGAGGEAIVEMDIATKQSGSTAKPVSSKTAATNKGVSAKAVQPRSAQRSTKGKAAAKKAAGKDRKRATR